MKHLLVATALLIFCVPLHAAEEPISSKPDQTEFQEPHWQLFLDDHVIAQSTGWSRTGGAIRTWRRGSISRIASRYTSTASSTMSIGRTLACRHYWARLFGFTSWCRTPISMDFDSNRRLLMRGMETS